MNTGCEKIANAKCSSSDGKGQCTCNDGYHDQGDGKTCVKDTELGAACSNECTGNTECIGEFCTCKMGNSAGDDLVCKAGDETIGSTCKNNVGCEQVPNSQCSERTAKGKCTCKDGFHAAADRKSCAEDSHIGDPCVNNSNCFGNVICNSAHGSGMCTCKSGFHTNQTLICYAGKTAVGSFCSKSLGCEFVGNSSCSSEYGDGVCECVMPFYGKSGDAACTLGAGLGESCDSTQECLMEKSICKNGKCVCETGYLVSGNVCKRKCIRKSKQT
ncbi:cell death abnormality protein 1-like [Ischnura elegans]|uniref:cell death abnormality protein 1-like n=1 Tax=Ischnura elegans TaxID=197161 RepID=UPI001ED894F1|nr:cell death abnormality protein 1-like [Ischnura elegans]